MRRIGFRHQRTLQRPVEVTGRGFVTGTRVRLRLLPAAPSTGIVFIRQDQPNAPEIAATASEVTDTQRRTTLGGSAGVTLVEHVLAALAGMRIDNCRIEIDGPEPPGLDGSALEFVHAIQESGAVLLHARREIWTVAQRLVISEGGATITMDPCTAEEAVGLKISYMLDYGPRGPLARQTFTTEVTPETFARELAPCRTFLLAEEVAGLKAQGIGVHLKPADVLVFDHAGPLDNRLRFANEPARHKLLDLIGDLSLCGFDLAGRIVAYRSGHALNARLALRLADLARPGRLTTRTVPAVWRRAA